MNEMTPRQRVAAAFKHGQPDRMPLDLMGTAGCLEDNAYLRSCEHLGVKHPGRAFRRAWNVRFYNEHVLEKLHVDFRRVWMREPVNWQPVAIDEQTERDEWGMLVKRVGNAAWFVNEPLAGASIDDLDRYAWPDPADPGRVAGLADEARSLYEETPYAISVRQATPGIFELAERMRGPANFMMDLAADVEFVRR